MVPMSYQRKSRDSTPGRCKNRINSEYHIPKIDFLPCFVEPWDGSVGNPSSRTLRTLWIPDGSLEWGCCKKGPKNPEVLTFLLRPLPSCHWFLSSWLGMTLRTHPYGKGRSRLSLGANAPKSIFGNNSSLVGVEAPPTQGFSRA